MKLEFSLVPYGMLSTAIPQVIKHLEVSESWTRGRSTVDDILKFLFTGQMQLWVVLGDKEIYGQIITEIKQYPQCKMLVIQYAAMTPNHMDAIEDLMQKYAEDYAVKAGCKGIEFVGRPGWKKHAERYGYTAQSVTYQRFFE